MITALRDTVLDFLDKVDWPLLLALCAVMASSLVVQSSAGGGEMHVVIAQGLRFVAGLGVMVLLSRVSPARLRIWTPFVFGLTLALLPLVFAFGSGRSARLWINLGVFYLQPGELLKISVPMMVAWYLHRVVLPPSWGSLLAWMFLMPYQKDRILMFLNPESDPLGAGWNIIQSKIAIGSGGWLGKGWGQGTQAHLDFLPEHTTDFAFSVLSEEWGWVGVSVVFALYLFIVGRCLWIAANARDGYSRLLAGALAMTFSVYVLVNGSMVVGLLPVVGVPMPLLSYGGTSAVSLLAGFGIIMSVRAHRKFMS